MQSKTLLERYVGTYDEYQSARAVIQADGGEIVRKCREEAGMTLREFAARIGLSHCMLSRIEKGYEILSPDVARRILNGE